MRLGLVGNPPPWFTGWARTARIEPQWGECWRERVGAAVDALLVDGAAVATHPDEVSSMAVSARDAGTRIVSFVERPDEAGGFADLEIVTSAAPLRPTSAARAALVSPVDVRRINPIGYRAESRGPIAALVEVAAHEPGWSVVGEWVATLPPGAPARIYDRAANHVDVPGATAQRLSADPVHMVQRLRTCAGVLDHPSFHPTTQAHAERLVTLACAGVPTIARDVPEEVRRLIGHELTDALEQHEAVDLLDPYAAERMSVTQRRLAMLRHRTSARWTQIAEMVGIPVATTSVTAVLATNRPQLVASAVAQAARQRHPALELVVVVHGDRLAADAERRLRQSTRMPLEVLHVPAAATLGDALNAGCRAASGSIITKLDDDDWYGVDHITDVLLALEYSGATVVGKAAEFIHLAALDTTIRRFAGTGERYDRNIAGGTLTMRRDDLFSVGGWRRIRSSVDQHLMDDVIGNGGLTFRTHGFGFVLNRHGRGHTWDLGVDYFLAQASSQRRGRDLGFAGVEPIDPVDMDAAL